MTLIWGSLPNTIDNLHQYRHVIITTIHDTITPQHFFTHNLKLTPPKILMCLISAWYLFSSKYKIFPWCFLSMPHRCAPSLSNSGQLFYRTEEKSQFPPDITPLILAAHYNNHEIIQMFLSRNHTIEKPHPISCKCTGCVTKQNYDSLKRSRSRLNAYRALASPAYMALSSPDPIMTTFELRQEMQKLAEVEKEFKVSK